MFNLDHIEIDLEKDLTNEPADQQTEEAIDKAVGTTLISIRMSHQMINSLKAIGAENNGIGYQTLIKQILQRFIDSESRRKWNDFVSEQLAEKGQLVGDDCHGNDDLHRKAA